MCYSIKLPSPILGGRPAVCSLKKFFFIPKEWFSLVISLNTCLHLPGVLDHRDTLENISGAEELSITWIEESSQFL